MKSTYVMVGLSLGACMAGLSACGTPMDETETGEAPVLGEAAHFLRAAEPVKDRYIVVLENDAPGLASAGVPAVAAEMAKAHGGRVHFAYEHALKGFAVEMSESGAQALARDPRVAYVEEDSVVRADTTSLTNPPWGLDRIDQADLPLDHRYTYDADGSGVNAYVIDSGIRISHTEFGNRAYSAYTAINDGNGTNDCNGHGTHVAGTIGGSTFGVAKAVRLHAVRVLGCDNEGWTSDIIAGVDWVTQNHVKPAVANMSLGASIPLSLDAAVEGSIAAGVVYVVAAGNDNIDACDQSPARVGAAITVGAVASDDMRAAFSNYGSCLDLFAPGVDIESAGIMNDTYSTFKNGTSMAAPHVAGVAALFLQGHPTAGPANVEASIIAMSEPNVVLSPGANSPNRLLSSDFISLNGQFDGIDLWAGAYNNPGGWGTDPSKWQTIQYPDLNGDGKADVCSRAVGGLYCALSVGNSFGAPSFWTTTYGNSGSWNEQASYYQTIRYPDLNGDGKSDVCGRTSGGIVCALSTGAAFGPASYWTFSYTDANGWDDASKWQTLQFPDLNGDGKADVCSRAAGGLYCALSSGNAFGASSFWTSSYGNSGSWNTDPSYWRTIQFPDLNGDGRADVCGRASGGLYCALSTGNSFGSSFYWTSAYSNAGSWNSDASYWQTIKYPDLNGDGKADVCGRASGGLYCALSWGNSFGQPTFWTSSYANGGSWASNPAYWETIQYADLNGDGRADVCGRGSSGLLCGLSSGSSFNAPYFWSGDYSDIGKWNTSPSYWQTIRFTDVNGDGRFDVCGRGAEGIHCAVSLL